MSQVKQMRRMMSDKNFEVICEVADAIYFDFMDALDDDVAEEFVETDPDNVGGTRNTEKGRDLYFLIEDRIRKVLNKEDE